MTIFVDNMLKPATVGRLFGRWSHLFVYPDTPDNRIGLHEFARTIGLKRSWFQDRPRFPHYDVTEPKRHAAIGAGAIPIDSRSVPLIIRKPASHDYEA